MTFASDVTSSMLQRLAEITAKALDIDARRVGASMMARRAGKKVQLKIVAQSSAEVQGLQTRAGNVLFAAFSAAGIKADQIQAKVVQAGTADFGLAKQAIVLDAGAFYGLVVGLGAVLPLLIIVAICFYRKHMNQKKMKEIDSKIEIRAELGFPSGMPVVKAERAHNSCTGNLTTVLCLQVSADSSFRQTKESPNISSLNQPSSSTFVHPGPKPPINMTPYSTLSAITGAPLFQPSRGMHIPSALSSSSTTPRTLKPKLPPVQETSQQPLQPNPGVSLQQPPEEITDDFPRVWTQQYSADARQNTPRVPKLPSVHEEPHPTSKLPTQQPVEQIRRQAPRVIIPLPRKALSQVMTPFLSEGHSQMVVAQDEQEMFDAFLSSPTPRLLSRASFPASAANVPKPGKANPDYDRHIVKRDRVPVSVQTMQSTQSLSQDQPQRDRASISVQTMTSTQRHLKSQAQKDLVSVSVQTSSGQPLREASQLLL